MKKTLLSVVTCGLALMACGQEPAPPKVVKDAFQAKFKTAQNVDWETEEDEWEAEFRMDGKKMSSSFDMSGNWLETETRIKKKDVPAQVFKSIALQFDGFEIEGIEGNETPDFKGYEIRLEKEEIMVEILCSAEGKITIKKVKESDEDEGKEKEDED